MKLIKDSFISRRGALLGAAASGVFLGAGVATAQTTAPLATPPVRRNISSFSTSNWRDHFDNLNHGAILCDIDSRAVQYWSEDESVYKLYPSSVPESEELTKRGYTSVIKKVEGPSWRPAPSMKIRNPDWPDYFHPVQTTPWVHTPSTFHGNITASTERATRGKLAANRRTDASAFTTNISKNCSLWLR